MRKSPQQHNESQLGRCLRVDSCTMGAEARILSTAQATQRERVAAARHRQTARLRPLQPSTIRSMEIVKQLSVFLENKPGILAAVCEELAVAKINILALTISDTTDHAVVRMVLSDPRKALILFEERGVLVVENNVLSIENSNKPGALAAIAQRLTKAKLNIEYAYLATAPGAKKGMLIMRVNNTKKALRVLSRD
jgi:hypothetical protein